MAAKATQTPLERALWRSPDGVFLQAMRDAYLDALATHCLGWMDIDTGKLDLHWRDLDTQGQRDALVPAASVLQAVHHRLMDKREAISNILVKLKLPIGLPALSKQLTSLLPAMPATQLQGDRIPTDFAVTHGPATKPDRARARPSARPNCYRPIHRA